MSTKPLFPAPALVVMAVGFVVAVGASLYGSFLALLPAEAQCLEAKILADVHAGNIESAKESLEKREALTDQPPDYIGRAIIADADGDLAAACDAYRGACRLSQPYACSRVESSCEGRASPR